MREILKGILDIHVHAGPSIAKREVDAADMLKEAQVAGYRGFLVKDHYFPTMMGTKMVAEHCDNSRGTEIYGALALNNSVGLFNLNAVDVAVNMGARIVYFPTVSSKNHIDHHKGSFVGSGKTSVPETPVVYVDEKGVMDPAAVEVLMYLAAKDVVLGTGHGTAWEIDHLVEKATELGVKRILVNHPQFHIGASYEQMSKWAKMGAYIELNVCVFKSGSKLGTLDDQVISDMLKAVPLERLILDSDMGQSGNGSPVEGMYNFILLLMNKFGLSEKDINLIAKTNPASLLGV
ncbi:DUF6282 family protein [Papillibacter cinnamivorans]|uniref:Cytosolic protein n=1 Tax=Papillibacter cinnamivorans DSM 12816 TaxID=1122930 RepID=A0A1W2A0P3_9FIRM|nr:DUF6282 family protein [Papillibacter cinnamivorans]SMC54257.1 hypothetical protein SAMN02745168_1377 [Papillibacter cinnamivorans DSM 12816]